MENRNYTKLGKELLNHINQNHGRGFRTIDKDQLKRRLKVFSMDEIKQGIDNAYNDPYHKKTGFRYLTPEYFLRNDKNLDKWLNSVVWVKEESQRKKISQEEWNKKISDELGI